MSISENILKIKSKLPEGVALVAVSKTKPICDLLEAYNVGQRIFGENKIQEMVSKYNQMPKDIAWHMIGHIQRNKVKYMAPFVSLIHGVDSLRLLTEINKQALKNNRIIHCLLQVKIATEENKFGLLENEVLNFIASEEIKKFKNIKIVGLMGMATFTDNQEQLQKEFEMLKCVFDNLTHRKSSNFNLKTLSMGMSDDYPIAIKNGSTMIRVGSLIFGKRTLA
ncbi:MAG: YggS family pyridoxal phosphate-dependent enzyme [Flavobacteriaceae bacterium]|jgi:PLP dependent protein|nr:YggS family pyridoxal phosphate-dependent enzyme [Flavobacteriaceae bacterium]|tara:strand:- start:10746 stop:11414 length:669 start_codon:yes stop_codon:yes gene_type:complete